jgi:hypothetical protein
MADQDSHYDFLEDAGDDEQSIISVRASLVQPRLVIA